MPLLGAHMSIAGGWHNALLAAQRFGCASVQLFTQNNNQWCAKELADDAVRLFRHTRRKVRLKCPLAHDCYLINLASPVPALYRQSVDAFVVEMQRAEALGLKYLVTHPGTATDGDEHAGLRRVAAALDECHRRCPGLNLKVLLETTAGQGRSLGHRFEHLARIFDLVEAPRRLGVCLDSCHVFAAGYALTPAKDYYATFAEFDRVVGLRRLKAFHLNDSKKPLGSRVDRHEHIGQGQLGIEPFRLLVNDPRFRNHLMILETPKEGPQGEEMDPFNLATLRALVGTAEGGKG